MTCLSSTPPPCYTTNPINNYPELKTHFQNYRSKLIWNLADFDEKIQSLLFEDELDPEDENQFTTEIIYDALKNAIFYRKICPVFCGTATG